MPAMLKQQATSLASVINARKDDILFLPRSAAGLASSRKR
jgi:hypothetical protein